MLQSPSKELGSLVSGKAKCEQTKANTHADACHMGAEQ